MSTGESTDESTGAAAVDAGVEDADTGWWHALTHPTRRGWTLIVAGAVTAGLLATAFLLPVPFVKLAPGPTFNVIGQEDGTDVISITGTECTDRRRLRSRATARSARISGAWSGDLIGLMPRASQRSCDCAIVSMWWGSGGSSDDVATRPKEGARTSRGRWRAAG